MNVTKPRRTRCTHSEEFKQSLIEACGEPGASVVGVTLTNGINANPLRRWMRERGIEPPELSCLPLRLTASEPAALARELKAEAATISEVGLHPGCPGREGAA
ncbi:transposase [Zoogloea sp.]|uniref:transposase n=1 Tax=Zoogloea sp. TaxID=49181 RepID=UPI0026074708|nr:transposase [Zoogloea sp.]MDD3354730.1 transposase [Zoogloea sp.]